MLISEKYSFNHFDKKSENKTGYDHIQVLHCGVRSHVSSLFHIIWKLKYLLAK